MEKIFLHIVAIIESRQLQFIKDSDLLRCVYLLCPALRDAGDLWNAIGTIW